MNNLGEEPTQSPEVMPPAVPATARRQMIMGVGGALAGLAAGLSFGTREARAETRPSLTTLDQRVSLLESSLLAANARLTQAESLIGESTTPYMWSGGSGTSGAANGPNMYRLDHVEENTCGEFVSCDPSGLITITQDGFYRFNFYALQYSSFLRWGSLNINGELAVWVDNSLQGEWSTVVIDQTFSLNAGDTVALYFLVSDGGTAYAHLRPGEPYSRLQITRIGL